MKSRIFATTEANHRDPIVLLNFQINYFLPPQMRAIFPVSTLKKHMWLSTPTKTAKKTRSCRYSFSGSYREENRFVASSNIEII
jgi:hypothetical protein